MKEKESLQIILEAIWRYMSKARVIIGLDYAILTVLYVLYGIKKGYKGNIIEPGFIYFESDNDELLNELFACINRQPREIILEFYEEITAIPASSIIRHYSRILQSILEKTARDARNLGEFYTSSDVTDLIAYLVNRKDCSSIYDPFCGTASIVSKIRHSGSLHFTGQELSFITALIAQVYLESVSGVNASIKCTDSLKDWDKSHFDAVVTCPPLGMKLSALGPEKSNPGLSRPYRTVNDLIISRAIHFNQAETVIIMDAMKTCFGGGNEKELRKNLVNENLIDTVIALPDSLLYGSSSPSVILICRKKREIGAPVIFVDATSCYKQSQQKKVFSLEKFKAIYETLDSKACALVPREVISLFDYNFVPSVYCKREFSLKDGQRVVRYSDILSPMNSSHGHRDDDSATAVFTDVTCKDFIKVLLNQDKDSEPASANQLANRRYSVAPGETYLLCSEKARQIQFALRTGVCDFRCSGMDVYRINKDIITPEYLVYILLKEPLIQQGYIPFNLILNNETVIDNFTRQKEIVSKQLQIYDEQIRASREADARRLGIKRNISDLEHMLGSTQLRIDDIINTLEEITPEATNYQKTVRALKDNVEYMNRLIKYSNAQISPENFNIRKSNIADFVSEYAESWRNYGGGYFRLDVESTIEKNTVLDFDRVMLTVMLDSILSNAVRHGFRKRKNYTPDNRVEIRLSEVEYGDKPFVLIQVSNNGDPISEGFTLQDYISRGRHASDTGRSGLGGHHVYQIAKGHNGYLYLDRNKVWNTIVEVLLPLEGNTNDNIDAYEHECI